MKIFRNFSMLNAVLFGFFILVLTSCGDKDDDKKDARSPRLNEVWSYLTEDYPASIDSSVMYVDYNQKNLVERMFDSVFSINFQYSDDGRISQMDLQSDSLYSEYTVNYIWSGNSVTLTESDSHSAKLVFEFNSDGFISRVDAYDLIGQAWLISSYTLYFWDSNNLISTERWELVGKSGDKSRKHPRFLPSDLSAFRYQLGHKTTSPAKVGFYKSVVDEYTYDNKKNPYKDFQAYWFTEIGYYRSENNVKSYTSTVYQTDGEIYETYQTEYNLLYNQDNFLSELSLIYDDWSSREVYYYE